MSKKPHLKVNVNRRETVSKPAPTVASLRNTINRQRENLIVVRGQRDAARREVDTWMQRHHAVCAELEAVKAAPVVAQSATTAPPTPTVKESLTVAPEYVRWTIGPVIGDDLPPPIVPRRYSFLLDEPGHARAGE